MVDLLLQIVTLVGIGVALLLSLVPIVCAIAVPFVVAYGCGVGLYEVWRSEYRWSIVWWAAFVMSLVYIVYVEWPTYDYYRHEYIWDDE